MRLNLSIFGSLALATTFATGCMPSPVTSTGGSFPTGGNTSSTSSGTSTTTDGGVAGSPTDSGTPSNPLNNGAHYSGVYNANAQLDFTQPGVLPGLASPALAALSEIGTDPGDALVNLAQAAGAIDLDSTTRSIIGSVITQQLDNVIPSDVQQALTTISNITAITKTSTLQNSMTIHTPAADGSVAIDLTVNGVAFDFVDINLNKQHVVVNTSAVNLASATTSFTATLVPHPNAPIADADLIFNGGTLALPVGDWILQAMAPLVFEPEWGTTDLQSTLQQLLATPCNDLGPIVEQGVEDLTGLDVGSTVGTTICTTAINLAATEITSQVDQLKINGVTISNGRATLLDVSPAHPTADDQSDLISNGTWTWSFGGADVPAAIGDGNRTATSN